PGRAPGRAGGAGLDRGRVPVHGRRPDPHRPVGRRGRPPERVLGGRPALDRGPRGGPAVRQPGAVAHPRGAGTGGGPGRHGAVGPGAVGAAGGGAGLRRGGGLADGQTFDGMESWLPWLVSGEHLLADLLPSDALVLLVEPSRMRDRAADLLAEEADLATTLARTWEAGDRDFPELHLPFDRLLAHTEAPVWSLTAVPEGPRSPQLVATGWDPVLGDGTALAKQLGDLLADDHCLVVAADGAGSADRVVEVLAEHG